MDPAPVPTAQRVIITFDPAVDQNPNCSFVCKIWMSHLLNDIKLMCGDGKGVVEAVEQG